MVTFEECGQMLDEIADSMPYELYRELNGGISLLPQLKVHPSAVNNDLFILGEYIRNSLGNAIVFYYGSINRVYGKLDKESLYKQLVRIFHHEVRHHNEYLAGCDDLGIYDKVQIENYLRQKGKIT
ncbi:MAG: metallopeptidase family protein [Clostridiales bacterium]|nr:metallopeptidase family protein [Clostridiales bacterium]